MSSMATEMAVTGTVSEEVLALDSQKMKIKTSEEIFEPKSSTSELRSILQALATKFYAATDVSQIQNINAVAERVQVKRAQEMVVSRDILHRKYL